VCLCDDGLAKVGARMRQQGGRFAADQIKVSKVPGPHVAVQDGKYVAPQRGDRTEYRVRWPPYEVEGKRADFLAQLFDQLRVCGKSSAAYKAADLSAVIASSLIGTTSAPSSRESACSGM